MTEKDQDHRKPPVSWPATITALLFLSLTVFAIVRIGGSVTGNESPLLKEIFLPYVSLNGDVNHNGEETLEPSPHDLDPGATDPLTDDEVANMAQVATGLVNDDEFERTNLIPDEVLRIERHIPSKDELESDSFSRASDVVIYRYATDTLHHYVIDNETGGILSEALSHGVQPPLTENELERAAAVVWEDQTLRAEIGVAYRAITGQQLTDLNQLNIKAFVFYAGSVPEQEGLNPESQACGLRRCAQLLLYTQDENITIELTPIINLSNNTVTQVLDF